jgi:hypothetical protein
VSATDAAASSDPAQVSGITVWCGDDPRLQLLAQTEHIRLETPAR